MCNRYESIILEPPIPIPMNCFQGEYKKNISVDACLADEIMELWGHGIQTTGCCCGHGGPDEGWIGVQPAHIPRMEELGYVPHIHPLGWEGFFNPKTQSEVSNG